MDKVKIADLEFEKLLSKKEISDKIDDLAKILTEDYGDKKPVFLVVLTGSIFFATDLLRRLKFDLNVQVVSAKSYVESTESSGVVKIENLNMDINGRDVLLVEDIVDTGITLSSIYNQIKRFKPSSVETVALLSKPSKRIVQVNASYIGFEIPEQFVVGYGMDYKELGRNLEDIYILPDEDEEDKIEEKSKKSKNSKKPQKIDKIK